MKYVVAALAFAAAASAQSPGGIPQCAVSCIDDARTKETSCAANDYKCICSQADALTTAATSCVLSACGADIAVNEVIPAVQSFCAAANGLAGASVPAVQPTSESSVNLTKKPTGYPTAQPTSLSTGLLTASFHSSHPEATPAPSYGGSNATTTTSTVPVIPTAGAAVAGSIGSFAMMALGALAAF